MEPIVSAVLLAAGLSSRMGRSKQLLLLGNKPVIKHCLDVILASGIRDIVATQLLVETELAQFRPLRAQ